MLARSPLAPPGPVGEVTAEDDELGVVTHNQANAREELTLGASGAGSFDGYETEQEAAVAASSSERVGVVVADAGGRFHAYETDLLPVPSSMFTQTAPFDLPAGRVVRWTRVKAPGDNATIDEKIAYAHELKDRQGADDRLAARQLFVGILVGPLGLQQPDVNDSTGSEPLPGKVNFDLEHTDSKAHAGVSGAIPKDRTTALPVPTLEIGPRSFEDVVALRATLLHEFEHMRHAQLTIEAVERWRATNTKLEFDAWAKQHYKGVEQDVILEQVTSAAQSTEALSYARGFMASYHLRDVAAMPVDVAFDTKLFLSLHYLSEEWFRAGHAVHEEVAAQLLAYRDATMSPAHRARFDAYVKRRFAGLDEKAPDYTFWKRFSA